MKRIAVIGSNSFSGSHFVNLCLSENYQVLGLSRSEQPLNVFLPYNRNEKYAAFSFERLDLNHDLAAIMQSLNKFRPSVVVNFAAQGMVAQSWEKPQDWFQTNTLSMVNFHDSLRSCDYLDKYVHISTPEVYGTCKGLVAESTSYNPSTPYAVSRAAADLSLMSFVNAYDFPVVFTRAANVFGPGQQLYRIIPISILNFLTGEKIQLHGGGVSVRSFIHIEDVVSATLKAALLGSAGDIFHISTDRMISIRDLVELIANMMDISFEQNVTVSEERLGKDSAYLLDASKAKAQLDWQDKVSLEDGIEDTIGWVRDNLDVLSKLPRNYIHKQ